MDICSVPRYLFRPLWTTSEKIENVPLFLQLDLPSKLNRHENGAFRKRSLNRRNLKTTAFSFCLHEKHFENGGVRKRSLLYNQVISLTECFPNTNSNWITGDCYVLKFLRRSVDGKHLTRFRNENSILKLSVVVSGWCLVEFSSGSGTVIRRYRQSVK